MPDNPLLVAFERHLVRKAPAAARVLGVPYSTYAQYRNGSQPLPSHLENHIDAIQRLPLGNLHQLICDRLTDDS